jgi:lactoylglutathione lyase
MQFTFAHNSINVLNLERSLAFYREALQLTEVRRHEAPDGSFIIVFLGDGHTLHQFELTWLRDRKEAYNLGDNEFHLALKVDDFAGAHALHEKMGCICYENKDMVIYFINDPDDYWIEIIPQKK